MAESSPHLTRRQLLMRGAVAATALGAGAFAYTWLVEPFWWRSVHRELPIRDLPSALDGRTLVHVSDLHIGLRVDEEFITKAVSAVVDFDPAIVAITGDLVHYLHPRDGEQASRVLAHLKPGRLRVERARS